VTAAGITVVCDHASHAPKACKVAHFTRSDGLWSATGATVARKPSGKHSLRVAYVLPDGAFTVPLTCRLCKRSLPPLDTGTLDRLAAQGVSQIAIKNLVRGKI
jgi:hypothetical protein